MQDVPRGFASACRRACLSVAVGCLFAESPLYHFNAPIGYDNCSIVYVLDTHENSMAEFVRACETMDHNARRLQTRQNFLRSFSISGGSGKRRNIYNCDATSLRWIIKKCRNVCVTVKREKKRKSEYERNMAVAVADRAFSYDYVERLEKKNSTKSQFPTPPTD